MWALQDAKTKFSAVSGRNPRLYAAGGDAARQACESPCLRRRNISASAPMPNLSRGCFVDHLLAFPGMDEDGETPRAEAVLKSRPVEF